MVKKKGIWCKKCDTQINPVDYPPSKTWQLMSPMPDKQGRVTLTVMGSFRCPNCGKAVRGVLKKIKGDEIGSTVSKKELLINSIKEIQEPTAIEEISVAGINSPISVEKAIIALIKAGSVTGEIKEGKFYPN